MPQLRILCSFALLTTLANFAFAQGGFRVDVQEVSGGPTTSAASKWSFRLQQKSVFCRWNCTSFSLSKQPSLRSDAFVSAMVVAGQGAVSVDPGLAEGVTNVAANMHSTHVDMTMIGTGKLDVLLTLKIDEQTVAAGEHSTTVELTVTGL